MSSAPGMKPAAGRRSKGLPVASSVPSMSLNSIHFQEITYARCTNAEARMLKNFELSNRAGFENFFKTNIFNYKRFSSRQGVKRCLNWVRFLQGQHFFFIELNWTNLVTYELVQLELKRKKFPVLKPEFEKKRKKSTNWDVFIERGFGKLKNNFYRFEKQWLRILRHNYLAIKCERNRWKNIAKRIVNFWKNKRSSLILYLQLVQS